MSHPEVSVLGMGLPIIDRIGKVAMAPTSREKVELHRIARDVGPKDGGVIPNILSNYVALSDDVKQVRLLAGVGEDTAGYGYINRLDRRIQNIDIIRSQETAQLYDLLTTDGSRIWQLFLGAAAFVSAGSKHYRAIQDSNSYFMIDINTIREPEIMDEANRTLGVVNSNQAHTIVNLSGIQGIDETRIRQIASTFSKPPLAVFGNVEEFAVLEHSALQIIFADTRLQVKTMAEEGSIMTFDGIKRHIPSVRVPDSQFRSSVGCGDSFMGSFLALCLAEKPDFWSAKLLERSANFGSFMASETAESHATLRSRGH
ncbi:hypothetical protein COT94_03285 [Candidatus Falkowbacteria bacterium CG10_big_fil_rev_8_21_14_0_10_37_14]|uniref:Carbohydrate kinase PfkB domain-containing protein n=1 Tax=Candidatus Falkowbacteria bacterium CG10_big_fil_rev_8_21_14_0_10_37_14 TaxID=1974561 RepID=A0A2M6WSX8_9BACT|nr:MAG: hypothetical protein COT94_03285 [Candidatus Falkowbacteria bacterium CG10_big_fil_rev_8_21_14_0_10_37_14]